MKIGILTFHHSRNYGAVLQAYGLIQVLIAQGHIVETIDYRNQAISERSSFIKTNNPLIALLKFINGFWSHYKKIIMFNRFEKKYLNRSSHIFSPSDIEKSDYDCIIIGSDQVWSPIITDGPDKVYWGNYKPKGAFILSYAASSCDINKFDVSLFENISSWVSNFSAISVREQRLKTFIESKTNVEVSVVCDPTILAGRDVFDKITSSRVIRFPYVFLYSVENDENLLLLARKVAKEYNATLVTLGESTISSRIKNYNDGIVRINASVSQMLSLIKYAECVVALSFHGTALSLLFEKDFYSVRGKNMARVEDLLKPCHLMGRIIDTNSIIKINHIDYTYPLTSVEQIRNKSKKWLIKRIK